MKKRYQIFISSTYEDLKEERKAVMEGIIDLDCFPAGMEQFSAASTSQFEYIKKRIDESDYYVLIIAGRYGSVDVKENISYTEKEFNYALKKGIPILVFINNNIDDLPNEKRDNDKSKFNKLKTFIARAKEGRLIAYWNNCDDLKYKVNKSLGETFLCYPRRGWIKEDDLQTIKLNTHIKKLKAENKSLKLENKMLKEKIENGAVNFSDKEQILVAIYKEYEKDIINMRNITARKLGMDFDEFINQINELVYEELIEGVKVIKSEEEGKANFVSIENVKITLKGIKYIEENLKWYID